jgi:flagellin-like hook-associated protein FlgL
MMINSISSAMNALVRQPNAANGNAIKNTKSAESAPLTKPTPEPSAAQASEIPAAIPIKDAAAALQALDFLKSTILKNPGAAMLAQANQAPQSALNLLA